MNENKKNGREGEMSGLRLLAPLLGAICVLLWAGAAPAQAPETPTVLPTTEVIGTSPLIGSGIDRDKVPANVRSLGAGDITREGVPDLTGTLQRRVPSATIDDTLGSQFQSSIQFRGFEASPVPGQPQGLAVYQNGVRINEAFGDTVHWDLIPEVAIDRLNLVTGNPVFGLNALGGALALEMKNGFTFQGLEGEVHGGSFARRAGSLEYGAQFGNFGAYLAGEALNENGWRDSSPSEIRRLYSDFGAKGERAELHLSFSGASNRFGATAATPVELLNLNRESVFTTPQVYKNDLAFVTLNGSYKAADNVSIEGNVYYRGFRQHATDGNTADVEACDDDGPLAGLLCFGGEDTALIGLGGDTVPDILGGLTAGSIDRTTISSDGVGATLQLTSTAALFGRGNHFVVGASYDRGNTRFNATSELGTVGPDLFVTGTGITIAQPTGEVAPTSVRAINNYYGVYVTDTFDLTPELSLTAGGRFNLAEVRLEDQIGTDLNGDHWFSRFNPGGGATYKLTPNVTAYAGYSEANRAPTPSELGCADPARPCLLANFVVSDPPLKQVVSRTLEAGLRGGFDVGPENAGRISWNFGLFRTNNQDDIIAVASEITGRGFFQNAGDTRRQGIETGVNFRSERWFLYADYSFVDATFQSTIALSSPDNAAAVDGLITVHPGDHLPTVPEHRIKAGAEYRPFADWKIGADLVYASSQFLRGDEANQNPKIPGYWLVNLHTSYEITKNFEVFGLIQNLFDQNYETFGTFFDPSEIPSLGLTDPRTLTPGAPLAGFAGVRIRF
jgi:iron complex outermembrane receptor protein